MRNISETLTRRTIVLQPSGIRRFFDIARTMGDIIPLGVGGPDSDMPWPIREGDIYPLECGHIFYMSNADLNELHEEIVRYIQCRFDIPYEPLNKVTVTVDGSKSIDLTCRAVLDPGGEVITPQPSYASYEPCVRLMDDVPIIVGLKEKDCFKLMPEGLEKATAPRTKLLVLPFPNNSAGSIMIGEESAAIAEITIRYDLYMVSDEIYTEFTHDGEAPASIIQIPSMQERIVPISGFSKAHVMTGRRLSYACGPELVLRQMIKVHQYAIMYTPTTNQYAVVAALHDCDTEIARMREAYSQRRRYLLKRLEEMNIPCFEPEGVFYTFPNISKSGMSSEELYTKLLTEEKITVVLSTTFGQGGEGFIRISYAYSLKQPHEAMGYIQCFVERYAN